MSSFPSNLQPAVPFITEHFRYADGRPPSSRTIQDLKKDLAAAIVKFRGIEFIDTEQFAKVCREKLEPARSRRRIRFRKSQSNPPHERPTGSAGTAG